MTYTVNELARLSGVTVRALHHYDSIGLLRPEQRTDAGYRLYGPTQLERLQQILFLRELDFPLDEIAALLNSPDFDRERTLWQHRGLLELRIERLQRLLGTLDRTLQTMKGETTMSDNELFDSFDMTEIEAHKVKYAAEVDEKYPGWQQRDKTKHYGKREWARVMQTGSQIQQDLASLLAAGREPRDAQVQAVIARHHAYIDDSFYDCSLQIYAGLADLYVDDERFTKNIDKVAPGLAAFQSAAMKVYCMNQSR